MKRSRLAAAHLSGDVDRIQRAEMRLERNRLRVLWRRDPREPGRTIALVADDEAICRIWAARQGFQIDVLDRDFPAFSDACRWIWARMSRGLISDDEVTAKLARLRSRIMGASRAKQRVCAADQPAFVIAAPLRRSGTGWPLRTSPATWTASSAPRCDQNATGWAPFGGAIRVSLAGRLC